MESHVIFCCLFLFSSPGVGTLASEECQSTELRLVSILVDLSCSVQRLSPTRLCQKIDKLYAAFTGQPLEKVQQHTERDRFFSSSEWTFELGNSKPLLSKRKQPAIL